MRSENEEMRKRLGELEKEVVTKRVLVNEFEAGMRAYKEKYQRLEDRYNNVSIDELHKKI